MDYTNFETKGIADKIVEYNYTVAHFWTSEYEDRSLLFHDFYALVSAQTG